MFCTLWEQSHTYLKGIQTLLWSILTQKSLKDATIIHMRGHSLNECSRYITSGISDVKYQFLFLLSINNICLPAMPSVLVLTQNLVPKRSLQFPQGDYDKRVQPLCHVGQDLIPKVIPRSQCSLYAHLYLLLFQSRWVLIKIWVNIWVWIK